MMELTPIASSFDPGSTDGMGCCRVVDMLLETGSSEKLHKLCGSLGK